MSKRVKRGRMKYLTPAFLEELDAVKQSKNINKDCDAIDVIAKHSRIVRKKIKINDIIEELL